MKCRTPVFLALLLIALPSAVSCDGPTDPLGLGKPGALSPRVWGIRVTLTVSPSVAAPGDTVRLTVTAHNSTDRRIQIGLACGPAMDAVITAPDGHRVSVLSEMLGPNGAFTCELGPYHFADPGETETVRLAWRASARRGDYTAVGGLRTSDGELYNVSQPVVIRVR